MQNDSIRAQVTVRCQACKLTSPSGVADTDADAEFGDGAEAVDAAGVEALSCRLSLGSAAAAPESLGESDLKPVFIIKSYMREYRFLHFWGNELFTHRCA